MEPFPDAPEPATGAERPFFVVGSERSGTTMLRLMLNRHARLCVPPESHFVTRLVDLRPPALSVAWFLERLAADDRFAEWGLPLEAVRERIGDGAPTWGRLFGAVYAAYAAAAGKPRWGDKTPAYVSRLPTLAEVFGDLQVVHIIRDGRDVAASLKRVDWGSDDVVGAARRWRRDVEAAQEFGRRAGAGAYCEVVYERLVRDPEGELGRVCAFLGERFDPDMLRFFEDAGAQIPAHRQAWHQRTFEPVSTAALERWRRDLTAIEVAAFERVAGGLLARLGYAASNASPALGAVALWWRRMARSFRRRRGRA